MKCLKCGNSNPENAAYCQKCNAYLAEPPGMENLDAFKALILGLFFTGIFYLVFPMPVVRNEYLMQLFSGRISETIFSLIFSLNRLLLSEVSTRCSCISCQSFDKNCM